ncbi:GMC family oxidoreductase [Parasphingorhabdus cellanae]|uniref:GMC family oxidoreductase n=1 Tax=Parasphingorhabdus cellanae TaxID=2806553 RepID=A0ABX7T8I8_9SPHN|nr:GMC family oxidoreductase [Parasphingorhabdus cellanae]
MIDLRESDPFTRFEADICIVGSGAAGITLARQLARSGLQILLLESGGIDFEADIQALADGPSIGHDYYPLVDARLRFFGGTTAIWGGRCAEFNPIDLERRDWVPHSGWPISHGDLLPYYDHARTLLGLPPRQLTAALWPRLGRTMPGFAKDSLTTDFWQFTSQTEQFTLRKCGDLVESGSVRILLHATVTAINTEYGNNAIESITVGDVTGYNATIKAKQYILAAGGIENARLMLASNIGNNHDQVGRYFMEHPHARGGRMAEGRFWQLLKMLHGRMRDDKGHMHAPLIRPSAAMQKREGILNSAFSLAARQAPQANMVAPVKAYNGLKHALAPTKTNRSLWLNVKKVMTRFNEMAGPLRPRALTAMGWDLTAIMRAEQAPNPDSRVKLAQQRDALGMPLTELDWRFSELDKHSVKVMMQEFATQLELMGIGRFDPAPWLDEAATLWTTDPLISAHAKGGYHHMGTTRMSGSPRTGVVDADCRVHGVHNLYIAGSSVFATSGWANPTLGIMALSLRLADHLTDKNTKQTQQLSMVKA